MTKGAGQRDSGAQKPCACGCGRLARPRSRYHSDGCRARASRQRRGAEPAQVKRCQVTRGGTVSVTLHLPDTWQHRTHELVPGTWVDVVPHKGDG